MKYLVREAKQSRSVTTTCPVRHGDFRNKESLKDHSAETTYGPRGAVAEVGVAKRAFSTYEPP